MNQIAVAAALLSVAPCPRAGGGASSERRTITTAAAPIMVASSSKIRAVVLRNRGAGTSGSWLIGVAAIAALSASAISGADASDGAAVSWSISALGGRIALESAAASAGAAKDAMVR